MPGIQVDILFCGFPVCWECLLLAFRTFLSDEGTPDLLIPGSQSLLPSGYPSPESPGKPIRSSSPLISGQAWADSLTAGSPASPSLAAQVMNVCPSLQLPPSLTFSCLCPAASLSRKEAWHGLVPQTGMLFSLCLPGDLLLILQDPAQAPSSLKSPP